MYKTMLCIRLVEERLSDLLEADEVKCPCHLYIGQEAVATGVCAALRKDDYIWGTHRSHGHYIAKGGDVPAMLAEILGKDGGCARGRGGSMHLFAGQHGMLGTVPIVAATIPIAVGAALAFKMRGDGRVSVSFFGDGATEEGHFHESMNLAALYTLPVVFVCENNLYSSHMHIEQRRPADNIFKIAEIYNIPGIRLDGNDVLAVHQAAVEAVGRAREGKGPTLLECRTYRWRGHVGPSWDMDVGVKRRDELREWMPRCPIKRTRERLIEMGVSEAELETDKAKIQAEVEQALAFARQSPYPDEAELEDHVYTKGQGDS
jgi:pyruvate dehydrogenase E1 component alpha subunit